MRGESESFPLGSFSLPPPTPWRLWLPKVLYVWTSQSPVPPSPFAPLSVPMSLSLCLAQSLLSARSARGFLFHLLYLCVCTWSYCRFYSHVCSSLHNRPTSFPCTPFLVSPCVSLSLACPSFPSESSVLSPVNLMPPFFNSTQLDFDCPCF